jgi:hypothetical protein
VIEKKLLPTLPISEVRQLHGGLTRQNFRLIGILNEFGDSVYSEILYVPLKNNMRSQNKWSEYPSRYELFRTPCGDAKFCLATSTIEVPRLYTYSLRKSAYVGICWTKKAAFIFNQPKSSVFFDSTVALARKTEIQYKLRRLCSRSLHNVEEAVALLGSPEQSKFACKEPEELAKRFEVYLAMNEVSDLKACLDLIQDNSAPPLVTRVA